MKRLTTHRGVLAAMALGAAALVAGGCAKNSATNDTGAPAVGGLSAQTEGQTGGIAFRNDLPVAMKDASSGGKIVMVDVYTDWCGWCKKLDADVYSQPNVAAAVNKGFIPVKLNPEKDPGGAEFAKKYKVDGFPTIIFLNGKGEEVHRIVGYVPVESFLAELKRAGNAKPGASQT